MRSTLVNQEFELNTSDINSYLNVNFELTKEASQLEVELRYSNQFGGRFFISVKSPEGFCGFSMDRQRGFDQTMKIIINDTMATPGSVPTPIHSGNWQIIIDPHGFNQQTKFHLQVTAVIDEAKAIPEHTSPSQNHRELLNNNEGGKGWYKGELHSHTFHSDGVDSPQELINAARLLGLDYIAITDHNTIAGWKEIENEVDSNQCGVTVIKSLEITSKRGHANVHGITSWFDPLIDREDHSFNDLIHQLKDDSTDLMVSVNHPFSNFLGWQQHDTDWAIVDSLEIYHNLENQHNILQLAFWDHLLVQGYAIVGIGGTDSHDAYTKKHRLGQLLTYVYAENAAPSSILKGLKSGRVFVSLGPKIEFTAIQNAQTYQMFESTPQSGMTKFHVRLTDVDRPSELYVIKNGLFFDRIKVTSSMSTLEFTDCPSKPSYYRLELHAPPFFTHNPNAHYRSWDSFTAASNPIFVGGSLEGGYWKQ